MGRTREALKVLESIPEDDRSVDVLLVYAKVLESVGNNEDALKVYSLILERDYNEEALFNAATLHYRHGEYEEAIHLYESIKNKSAVVLNNLGVVYKAMGRHNDAVDYFLKSVNAGAQYPEPLYNLALIQYEHKKYDAADKWLERYSKLSKDLRYLLLKGAIEEERGNLHDALILYKKALKYDPANDELKHTISDIEQALSKSTDEEVVKIKEELRRRDKELKSMESRLESAEQDRNDLIRKIREDVVHTLRSLGADIPENINSMSMDELRELKISALEDFSRNSHKESVSTDVLSMYDELISNGDTRAMFSKAMILYNEGDMDSALNLVETILEKDPAHRGATLLRKDILSSQVMPDIGLGFLYYNLGMQDKALRTLELSDENDMRNLFLYLVGAKNKKRLLERAYLSRKHPWLAFTYGFYLSENEPDHAAEVLKPVKDVRVYRFMSAGGYEYDDSWLSEDVKSKL